VEGETCEMQTSDRTKAGTDRELVEEVAASLELPQGLVDDDQIQQWLDGLETRGWTIAERTSERYLLLHPTSGFQADLQARPFDPADPRHPLDAAPPDTPVHHAFSAVRLADGGGLLADANLADAQPDGSVSWLIARPGPNPESTTADPAATTTTANPFRRRRLAGLKTPLRIRVAISGLLLCTALIGSVIGLGLRRTSATSVR
jgi:hypothetical protein